jgi:DNA-binding MarR family transcriptional regulator
MSPSSSVSLCACASLRRASRAVNHLYDLVLAPTGLRITQFLILCAIAESEEIAHCELARRFFASEETFSRRLASARKAGWVEMSIDARRRRVYRLTEAGHALLRLAVPNWERAQERLCRQLGEKDWSALIRLAERVTLAAVAAECAPFRNSRPAWIDDEAPKLLDIAAMQPGRFPVSPSASDS